MSLIRCNPVEFVQSLTKSQRKALADILKFSGKGDETAERLYKAMEYAKTMERAK